MNVHCVLLAFVEASFVMLNTVEQSVSVVL